MRIIRLIGGIAAISIVAGTLIFSLKSVPKAVGTLQRPQKPAASSPVPTSHEPAVRAAATSPDELKKAEHPDEQPRASAPPVAVSDPLPATPATIHKCTDNGKITYSSAPC